MRRSSRRIRDIEREFYRQYYESRGLVYEEDSSQSYYSENEDNQNNYERMVWGIQIPYGETGRRQIEKREEERKRKEKKLKKTNLDLILDKFDWPICFNIMDPDWALLTPCWGKIWCFDWIIKWRNKKNSCPNCRAKIKWKDFKLSEELPILYIGILEQLGNEKEKEENQEDNDRKQRETKEESNRKEDKIKKVIVQ